MMMLGKLNRKPSGQLVLWLFGITICVYLAIIFYSIPAVLEQAPEMKLFDMSPGGYSYEYATELLEVIGPEGREKYLRLQLPIDFIYPGLFAVTYTLMLIWVFSMRFRAESKIFIMALVPAAAGLFDYIENIGIVMMIKSYPNLSSGLVQFTSTFSILKSIMTIASYILLTYGLLLLAAKRKHRY
jgi:hypothetical protein